jgi:hypothetical protein
MKEIGRTPEGHAIVEMSERERWCISQLQEAAKGASCDWGDSLNRRPILDEDISEWVMAVFQWTMTRFEVNEMRARLDELDKLLTQGANHEQEQAGAPPTAIEEK